MNNLQSLSYYWPEIILTVTVLVAILVDLFYSDKNSGKTALWVLGGLILTQIAIYVQDSDITRTLFMGNLAFDPFASFFKTLTVCQRFWSLLLLKSRMNLMVIARGNIIRSWPLWFLACFLWHLPLI